MRDFAKVFEWELEWIRSFVWVGGGWLADVEGDLEKPVILTIPIRLLNSTSIFPI